MHIEIWADLVCPWCFIGKRRLEAALSGLPEFADVTITHRAYQLDPSAISDGTRTVDHLAAKYGVGREQAVEMMDRVTEVAATVGLSYDLANGIRGNTRDGHRLVLWAQELGGGPGDPPARALMDDLYSATFERGESIFTVDDLCRFAQRAGLDVAAARAMLESDAFVEQVAADQVEAQQLGCTGVPFFVIDRRLGVSGAQEVEVFVQALRQAAELRVGA